MASNDVLFSFYCFCFLISDIEVSTFVLVIYQYFLFCLLPGNIIQTISSVNMLHWLVQSSHQLQLLIAHLENVREGEMLSGH